MPRSGWSASTRLGTLGARGGEAGVGGVGLGERPLVVDREPGVEAVVRRARAVEVRRA